MSAKKVFETKIPEDENTDSGFLSGPLSEQLSEEFNSREHTEHIEKSEKNISSESTDLDSGLDLCITECLSNVNLGDTPTAPIIIIEPEKSQDIPPLSFLFQQDDDGDTQLHIAAVHGCEKSVGTLIRVCPDKAWLDVPNDYGHTPLHLAVLSGHAIVTRMLVRAGASIGIRDRTGGTPLHIAVEKNNLECLQALLAPVPEHPPRKLSKSTVLNQKNYRGQACVHVAASSGHLETLQMLVYYGADINAMEGLAGRSALHIAVLRGDLRLVKHLLERCAGVLRDALDYAGRTPRKLARSTPAARVLANMLGDDDDDSDSDDDMYDSDSEPDSLFEKLRQNLNPINVA